MRHYCSACHYPLKTCVCSAAETIDSDVQFLIIQHNKEAHHAKNTARLVRLALPATGIIISGTGDMAQQLSEYLQQSRAPALIYPSDTSVPLESDTRSARHDLYILLDGSWKQAYGLWKSLPQLHNLPQYHFENAPVSEYEIRHTKFDKSLSTLEAAAYTLTTVSDTPATPLYRLQHKLQSFWQGPQAHRRTR